MKVAIDSQPDLESAATSDDAEPAPEEAAPATGEFAGLYAKSYDSKDVGPATIGALDDPATEERDTEQELQLHFTLAGAGVESIVASHHYDSIKHEKHYVVQRREVYTPADGPAISMASLATRAVVINGTTIDLFGTADGKYVWREIEPGSFVAEILNSEGEPVARIEKTYRLTENSFDIAVEQKLVNLTDTPLNVKWYQYGPVDLAADISGYRIDTRRIRIAHLLDVRRDATRLIVDGYQDLISLRSVRKKIQKSMQETGEWPLVWEGTGVKSASGEMVWIAQTGRYFAFAVHPLFAPGDQITDKALHLAGVVRAIPFFKTERMILQLESDDLTVAPMSELDRSFGAYAGPMGKRELITGKTKHGTADPLMSVYHALKIDGLIVYNLGGMCAMCTLQPLARSLLWFLMFAHDYLVFDWAVAIMLLVLLVRTVLHPIYKRSQISLQTFTKQMQRIGPKQKKLQEKFKDDPKRLQTEMARLMREENVKFTGALGCLPMFLQSPIWIALYAMLYFLFDLRHEAAFYGVFQKVSNGSWNFLADLSTPDRFIDFGRSIVKLPLMGDIRSINILPLFLGVVFFLHQKYISPPPSATMTDEQKQQQKIMKFMMVGMFPIFMYNAPSGLAIYFITNSCLGIVEGRWIRAHIDQLDLDKKIEEAANEGRKKVTNRAQTPPKKQKK